MLKPYFQPFSVVEDRDVFRGQRVLAGPEGVAELPEINELRDLRFAHDELRAVLDLLVVVRPAVAERVARVIGPFDDLDQFAFDEVHEAHIWYSFREELKVVGNVRSCGVGPQDLPQTMPAQVPDLFARLGLCNHAHCTAARSID